MNLLQKAKRWAEVKAANWVGRTLSLTDPDGWGQWTGGGTHAGRAVTSETAMQASAVFGCVRVLSESVGTLPWAVYERGAEGNATRADNHALAEVLVGSPNADMTDVEFREALITNLGLAGNAYSFIDRNGAGNVSSLYPLVSNNVSKRRMDDGRIQFDVIDRGKVEHYPQEKIWHVPGFGSNGLIGFSPIGVMRNAIALALVQEQYQSTFFVNGAKTSGVVKVADWLKDDQRARAKKILNETYAGADNAHKIMLLEGGMEYSATTMTMEDAEFLSSRKFQIAEIAGRIYRVPLHMIGELDRATNNNIEQMSLEFVMYTLAPYLTRIERSVNKWLLKPADRAKFFLRFNIEGLLRADSKGRAEFLAKMIDHGVMNRNEARAKENLNRVEGQGMDEYTVQSNMAPIEALAALLLANANKSPPADPAGKGVTINSQLNLPAELKHQLQQSISVPGLLELADQVKRSNDANAQATEQLRREFLKELKATMGQLSLDINREREAIFDDKGEPVGSRPKLH